LSIDPVEKEYEDGLLMKSCSELEAKSMGATFELLTSGIVAAWGLRRSAPWSLLVTEGWLSGYDRMICSDFSVIAGTNP